ncbi:phosphoribosylamine--glycine ligase [Pullulanibacillus pueri]|uniref:Phosphoribosylamine--glycine ligase n=1 Tax=Pullulanibacillus pueri TaxID=1437324 RepID=A0A8J2ZX29_9BACL|nr:phosphoribosylamine--glycine ligase [Pullulanibacillus pueri]MBM7682753.1 phosphoribosylamine--glycine ligase [Pullulanibacillus pueri]GGH83055.1 phosphoribosylamine--glycine ligase [Pullulanibacillus pueri]
MKVLVIGKGGREHAMVWKLSQSPQVTDVFVAPGSDGMQGLATCVAIAETDFASLIAFVKKEGIDLTVVGPEQPLVGGIVDRFKEAGLTIFGPSQQAAMIEGSKAFAKKLMADYQIPTAAYEVFTDYEAAARYVEKVGVPIVIKADGLAAGKGVTVALTMEEALHALDDALNDHRFGEAGASVVIEEFLTGEEFSLMAFVNGDKVYPMVLSQDHKRAFEGDQGPNTGGMGAYSPVPQLPDYAIDIAMEQVMQPTVEAMIKEARPFQGILYAGLMWTEAGPKVIEFNCRFGDPETQVVLPRLTSDLFDVFWSLVHDKEPKLMWSEEATCGFVLASKGYPGDYEKGAALNDLNQVSEETLVFHAGTKRNEEKWLTNGGRVLLVARMAPSLEEAIEQACTEVAKLANEQTFYRKDIGHRALNVIKSQI